MASDIFKWGILGTGPVSRSFLAGLTSLECPTSVSLVASREFQKACAFAQQHGIKHVAEDYALAASSPDVDGLYIATPPSTHEEYALSGIRAGKAILIEKPFVMNGTSARRVVSAAQQAGVFCMEAMWTRFLPLFAAIKDCIVNNGIGDIRAFRCSFGRFDVPDTNRSLFDPDRGGGALMHRGVYGISLARYLFGEISDVHSRAVIGRTGVDEDCVILLTHKIGVISTIRASLRVPLENGASIEGLLGTMNIRPPIYRPFEAEIKLHAPTKIGARGRLAASFLLRHLGHWSHQRLPSIQLPSIRRRRMLRERYRGNGYCYEAEEVIRSFYRRELQSATMPLEQSVETIDVADAARACW